jgi:glycosyltransferase involved in cell wall biosynthesis
MPFLSVIVPAYNEAASIIEVIEKIQQVALDKEVILVDDGSDDATGKLIERYADRDGFRLIHHPKNLGKAQAIASGLKEARGEIILIQDADLEYDPRDYPILLEGFSEPDTDIVFGSRLLGGGLRRTSVLFRMGNLFLTFMVNLLFASHLSDVETGYKVFRRNLIEKIELVSSHFDFEVEFTCKALRLGYKIREVPIAYNPRKFQEGKKIKWKDGLSALFWIVRCRLL